MLMILPLSSFGAKVWTRAFDRLKMRMSERPDPKRRTRERGVQRVKANSAVTIGKANDPKVSSRPRKRKRPSEAMRRAAARAPAPRADWRKPFVLASPWRMLTDQAGIRVTKAMPKRLTTAIRPAIVRIFGWAATYFNPSLSSARAEARPGLGTNGLSRISLAVIAAL